MQRAVPPTPAPGTSATTMKQAVRFAQRNQNTSQGPPNRGLAAPMSPPQTHSCTRGTTPPGDGQQPPPLGGPIKPILKQDPDGVVQDVNVEHDSDYTEEELDNLATLSTDSEPEDFDDEELNDPEEYDERQ